MQPILAQVVPYGPPSIKTTRPPWERAARYAARPALPAPMTATSAVVDFTLVPAICFRTPSVRHGVAVLALLARPLLLHLRLCNRAHLEAAVVVEQPSL